MTLTDLAEQLAAADPKLTKVQANRLVRAMFDAIRDSAINGNEVSLPGFGKFTLRYKAPRRGRNPATGVTINIPARRQVVFQPAKALKTAVAG